MGKEKTKEREAKPGTRADWRKMPVALFPHLCTSIGTEWLPKKTVDALKRLAKKRKATGSRQRLDALLEPRVEPIGANKWIIRTTGTNLSPEYAEKLRDKYAAAGCGEALTEILEAAHKQLVETIIIEPDGTILERRHRPKLPRLGKKKLGKKKTQRLLESLETLHNGFWPIEMLTNTLKPHFERTRR